MHKQTSPTERSLPLHEVLEAEFSALHGKPPGDQPESADSEVRLKAIWSAIHKEKPAALCLSGGGIRSATFGLGILQGLARCGLLEKFHYLSTVSGGGYIGSWLSAWIKNAKGVGQVIEELRRRPDSGLKPEPKPIQHLRAFSNYLAPKAGLTSVDFWTLVATWLRNIFLNWLVLISWLAAAMMVPRLYLATVVLEPDWTHWTAAVSMSWDKILTVLLTVAFALVALAMAYAIVDVPSTGNRRFSQSRFLLWRQSPLLVASLILAAWWALVRNVHGSEPFQPRDWLWKFVACTLGSYLFGGLLAKAFFMLRRSKQKPRDDTLSADNDARGQSPQTHSKNDAPSRRIRDAVLRTATIVLTAGFAGVCLWSMATGMFLFPSTVDFLLKRDRTVIEVQTRKEVSLPAGTQVMMLGQAASTNENEFAVRHVPEAKETAGLQRITIPADTHFCFEQKDPDTLEPILVPAPAQHALNYVCFAPALTLAVLLLVNFLFTGLASWVTEDEDREWWGRSAAWILITISSWIVVNVIVLWGAQAVTAAAGNDLNVFLGQLEANPVAKALLGAFGGVAGLIAALLALRSKFAKTAGSKTGFRWLLPVAAVAFFILLGLVISWALLWLGSQAWLKVFVGRWQEQLLEVFVLTAFVLLFGIVMGFFINVNKFSLHAAYRNRLIRAYLGASRTKRNPHLFTGFDPKDNVDFHELPPGKPFQVINAAINLVKGEQLAWQERKAESFTMSRLHCGSWHVGYRPSTEYGGGISLGTAMAISGAAANPNMGYHSSPIVGFLMTLFNVRLGWWLGNPGEHGAKTWRWRGPRYSVGPLFSEAIGNTTDHYHYVNLSDGGHFENLGLYEMVLRRCHFIVVSDAGEDPHCTFADLGEAVRKIRIDFGIPIEFESMSIYPRSEIESLKCAGHNCAIGQIRYSVVDGEDAPDGVLIYIKPACYGNEPRDIYQYFKSNPAFPHESTSDQFFSESQFESYRMLGAHTMQKMCAGCAGDFSEFIEKIFTEHLCTQRPEWLENVLAPEPREPQPPKKAESIFRMFLP